MANLNVFKSYDLQSEYSNFCKTLKVGKNSSAGKTHRQIGDDSADTYANDYLPALAQWLYNNETSIIEREFLFIVPFLLNQGEFERCSQVLLRLHRIITINSYKEVTPSFKKWRAAFNKYCLFIQHQYIDNYYKGKTYPAISISKSYNNHNLLIEIDNCIVYYYIAEGNTIRTNALKLSVNGSPKYNLRAIIDNRLKSQNRMSGDKTWLSFDLLARIDKNIISEYVDLIKTHTVLYYEDAEIIKNIKCKKIWCVALKRIASNFFEMYVTIKENNLYNTYLVYTPISKEGKKKVQMIIEGIDKVVIDHVKPIDQSLRELAAKIPTLEECSRILKDAKKTLKENGQNITNDTIVNEAYKDPRINNIKSCDLRKEMKILLSDSWYRLMDSKENSIKSNNLEFIEFCHDASESHIGVIMKVNDTSGNKCIVFRDLTTGDDYVQDDKSLFAKYYVRNVDLTSFMSLGWNVL